jgi:hypothetical protein
MSCTNGSSELLPSGPEISDSPQESQREETNSDYPYKVHNPAQSAFEYCILRLSRIFVCIHLPTDTVAI